MIEEEFNSIVFSPIMRTNEVKRYSGVYLQESENLSQHITDVMIMGYMISKKLNMYGENIDIGLFLEKALVHDLDEISTGDIPHNTKYSSISMKKESDLLAEKVIKRYSELDESLSDLPETWSHTKDGKEGVILKLCDILCIVRKSIIEVEIYNNLLFLKISEELVHNLEVYQNSLNLGSVFSNHKSIDFIESIVSYSIYTIKNINLEHMSVSGKYNIASNILRDSI